MQKNQSISKSILLKDIKKLKDRKGFLLANISNYKRLFARDALIAAWQLLEWNPQIAKATLEILCQYQGSVINDELEEEPGKILHETDFKKNHHESGHFPFPYYGSVDSTPLFLILFSFYVKKTGDTKFLASRWEHILRALNWMEEYGDKDKDSFLEYERKNPSGLFHQGWKDSFDDHLEITSPVAIVEAQGYAYLAFSEVSDLALMRDEGELSKRLMRKAKKVQRNFTKAFWMPDENYFALALDGKKAQKKTITSNPGHLLFTGIIKEDQKKKALVERLFQDDLWTPFGIRTHSTLESNFDAFSYQLGSIWPHDNWIIAQGLLQYGFKNEYEAVRGAIIRAAEVLNAIPEYYVVTEDHEICFGPSSAHPQAWATGALWNFLHQSVP